MVMDRSGTAHEFVTSDCPNTQVQHGPSPGHVDGPALDSCGFNEERYDVLTRHDDGSPKLVGCRACGEHIENG